MSHLPRTLEVLYIPTGHKVQCVAALSAEAPHEEFDGAPTDVKPRTHGAQAIVESELYWPAEQDVQLLPPDDAKLSVTDPALQTEQADVDSELYRPGSHAEQDDAPSPLSVFVIEPGLQS